MALLGAGRGRRGEEAAGFGDGDVEPSGALNLVQLGSDAASAPVPDGALWGVDEVAELLEGDQAVVVPLVGNLDRVQSLPFVARGPRRPFVYP